MIHCRLTDRAADRERAKRDVRQQMVNSGQLVTKLTCRSCLVSISAGPLIHNVIDF